MSGAGSGVPVDGVPVILTITPEATEAEKAAICAAYDLLWPADVAVTMPAPSPRWRYAGRRWHQRTSYGGWA